MTLDLSSILYATGISRSFFCYAIACFRLFFGHPLLLCANTRFEMPGPQSQPDMPRPRQSRWCFPPTPPNPEGSVAARCKTGARDVFLFGAPIDKSGIGVYATWAGVISAILTGLLALHASIHINDLNGRISAAALRMLALSDPGDLCINATRTFKGAVADSIPRLFCYEQGENGLYKGEFPTRYSDPPYLITRKDEWVPVMTKLLYDCGVTGWGYDEDALPNIVGDPNDSGNYRSPFGRYLMDSFESFRYHMISEPITSRYFINVSSAQTNFFHSSVFWYDSGPFHDGVERAGPREGGTIFFQTPNSSTISQRGMGFHERCAKVGMCTSATWQIKGQNWSLYMSIDQNERTAECLGMRLEAIKKAGEGQPPVRFDPEGDRHLYKLLGGDGFFSSTCRSGENRVFVFPRGLFVDYFCTEGVDDTRRERFDSYKQSFKWRFNDEIFLGLSKLGYDDIMAIYTGALAAAFGAAILTISTTAVILIVAVRRTLLGGHEACGQNECKCVCVCRRPSLKDTSAEAPPSRGGSLECV